MNKYIFVYLWFALIPLSIIAQTSVQPILMLRVEGVWHVFNTNGKPCWEPSDVKFSRPWGLANGLLNGTQLSTVSAELVPQYRQYLFDVKGEIVWSPKREKAYKIHSPPDAFGFAYLTDWDNEAGFVCDKTGNVVSIEKIGLVYLGEGIVAYPNEELTDDNYAADFTYNIFNIRTKKLLTTIKGSALDAVKEGVFSINRKEMKDGNEVEMRQYVQLSGKIIIAPTEVLTDENGEMPYFQDGVLLLQRNDAYTVFDLNGKNIFEKTSNKTPQEVTRLGKNLLKVKNADDELYQIFDTKGAAFNKESYEQVSLINPKNVFFVQNVNEITLFNRNGKTLKANIEGLKAQTTDSHVFVQIAATQFDIYDEQGKKSGTFEADSLGVCTFGLTVFKFKNEKGVLNSEGKIIFKAANTAEIELAKNYFQVFEQRNDEHGYDFYNRAGKLVLRDPATRLKADWIAPLEDKNYFRPF